MASFFDTLAGLGGKYIDSLGQPKAITSIPAPVVNPPRDDAARAALLAAGNAGPGATGAGPGPFGLSSGASLAVGAVLAVVVIVPMVVYLGRIRRG